MSQPLRPVNSPPSPLRPLPTERRSRTPSPLPPPTDSMESLRGTPSKGGFLTRLYHFFAALPDGLIRVCAYIKSFFVKEAVPQVYELPLGDQAKLDFCADNANGFPKDSHALFRQLRVDWCRRCPLNLGGKPLHTHSTNLNDTTREGYKYTEEKIHACERFLRERGVDNRQEIRSLLSCLHQGFLGPFQQIVTRAIPKDYTLCAVKGEHPYWMNLNAEGGVASIEACSRYHLVSMQDPSKPLTEIQLTIHIPDHRTGIAQCHMNVADRNALPPLLRTTFEQGSAAAEKSRQTYGPVRFQAPSTKNNPLESIAVTYKKPNGEQELHTQITRDLERNFTFYICGKKIEGQSAEEFLPNYTRMMREHGISDEDIESIQYCLHQGLIGSFTEELSIPFLKEQGYILRTNASAQLKMHLDIQEGKVTMRCGPFLLPLVDLTQLDPITFGPVTTCKMQLTIVIPDHRNPAVHYTDILFKETDRLPPGLEFLANTTDSL
jgi:hypothetical protein